MAVAPAAEILGLLEMVMITIVALMLFKWLVHSLVGWIPFIGGKAAAAADAVSTFVERQVEHWIYPQLHTLLNWFEILAQRVIDYPRAAWDALSNVDDAIAYLVKTKIPQLVHAIIRQLEFDMQYVKTKIVALDRAVSGLEPYVERRLHDYGGALSKALLDVFKRGIDRLQRDVIEPADHALREAIRAGDAALGRDVQAARDLARGVDSELGRLAKRLDIPLGLLEAMIGALGITGAKQALETLGRCEPKLRKMCTSDPNQWANLIEGLALLALWPGLIELTRMAAGVIEESRDVIRDVIINGAGS